MPLSYNTESPDSFQTLIKKLNAIIAVNTESLNFIESRKGQKVIVKNRFTLNVNKPRTKKRKNNQENISFQGVHKDGPLLNVMSEKITKKVDDVIKAWRYGGQPLTAETIAFNNFIDLKLESYEDLARLNKDYTQLSEKYMRIFTDQEESQVAVRCLLSNVQKLQIAIGGVHEKVLDVRDPSEGSKTVTQRIKIMARELRLLQQELPQLEVKVNSQPQQKIGKTVIPTFADCTKLSCKATLSRANVGTIYALENYNIDGEQYLASAQHNGNISLWNLENNTAIGSLTGHTDTVYALAVYKMNASQMIASGGFDNTIKLWNLENNTLITTILDHADYVFSLTVATKNDTNILISGGRDKKIRLHDLKNYDQVAELTGHTCSISSLAVLEQYLASGSCDKTIKLWSLHDHSLIITFNGHEDWIRSVKFTTHNDEERLASMDKTGCIKLWDLENQICTNTLSNDYYPYFSRALEVIYCKNQPHLARASKNFEICSYSIRGERMSALLNNSGEVYSLKAFVNGCESCIACGDSNGNIQLWME